VGREGEGRWECGSREKGGGVKRGERKCKEAKIK